MYSYLYLLVCVFMSICPYQCYICNQSLQLKFNKNGIILRETFSPIDCGDSMCFKAILYASVENITVIRQGCASSFSVSNSECPFYEDKIYYPKPTTYLNVTISAQHLEYTAICSSASKPSLLIDYKILLTLAFIITMQFLTM